MRIRPVEQHEIERLRELRLRALLDAPTAFGSTHADEVGRTLQEWLWWITPPSITFIAESGQSWPGLAVGRLDAGKALADVFSMWVAPEARGRGLGALLLERVIEWAWTNGARTVRLGVTEGNAAAAALYKRRGFEPNGYREPLRWNPDLTCVFMELGNEPR
jgi:GNAT superfamily N-acetyltransferase